MPACFLVTALCVTPLPVINASWRLLHILTFLLLFGGLPSCCWADALNSFFLSLFIYLFSASGGGAEREGKRIPGRLCTGSSGPNARLELTNHETMTHTEVRHLTDWATQVPLEALNSKTSQPIRFCLVVSTFRSYKSLGLLQYQEDILLGFLIKALLLSLSYLDLWSMWVWVFCR